LEDAVPGGSSSRSRSSSTRTTRDQPNLALQTVTVRRTVFADTIPL
jgi:hypothetical protein